MNYLRGFFQQPKGVYLLSFVELWNRFSHFGMRTLLVLFMIKVLQFSDATAFGIYAAFTALDKFGGIFGAILAKRILGLRNAIILGGWIIACGHLCLAFQWFFPGLALLVVGSCLFSSNIIAFVGNFYEVADERRSSGFTLFYMGINIGALVATILCGILAETIGWEYGFGLAAFGMMIGNLALMRYRHLLEGKGEKMEYVSKMQKISLLPLLSLGGMITFFAFTHQKLTLLLLPWITGGILLVTLNHLFRKKLAISSMVLYLIAYVLFISAESQLGSSVVVFAERMSSHTLFGFPISITSILSINPIVIILFGALASWVLHRLGKPFFKMFFPFVCVAICFFFLSIGPSLISPFPLSGVMLIVAIISFAELMISPLAYSQCSKIAVLADDPKVAGLIPVGHAFGATLGGGLSTMIAKNSTTGFFYISILILLCSLILSGIYGLKQRRKIKV